MRQLVLTQQKCKWPFTKDYRWSLWSIFLDFLLEQRLEIILKAKDHENTSQKQKVSSSNIYNTELDLIKQLFDGTVMGQILVDDILRESSRNPYGAGLRT